MQDCHWIRVGTTSRRIVPRMVKLVWRVVSTARRWQMRAPRSWPQRIMGLEVVEDGRAEERVVRMDSPVLRLSCDPGRGEERPYPGTWRVQEGV